MTVGFGGQAGRSRADAEGEGARGPFLFALENGLGADGNERTFRRIVG